MNGRGNDLCPFWENSGNHARRTSDRCRRVLSLSGLPHHTPAHRADNQSSPGAIRFRVFHTVRSSVESAGPRKWCDPNQRCSYASAKVPRLEPGNIRKDCHLEEPRQVRRQYPVGDSVLPLLYAEQIDTVRNPTFPTRQLCFVPMQRHIAPLVS